MGPKVPVRMDKDPLVRPLLHLVAAFLKKEEWLHTGCQEIPEGVSAPTQLRDMAAMKRWTGFSPAEI